jgi:hypothetical protein
MQVEIDVHAGSLNERAGNVNFEKKDCVGLMRRSRMTICQANSACAGRGKINLS